MTLSQHAKLRMQQRKITLEDIHNCICQGVPSVNTDNSIKYYYNHLTVVVNPETDNIITVYYKSKYYNKVKSYCNKNNITLDLAFNQIRKGLLNIC